MVINLHFQFGNQLPVILPVDVPHKDPWGNRYLAGFTYHITDYQRRKIRETYEKVFHRKAKNAFRFYFGTRKNDDMLGNFTYHSRYRPRLVIPTGRIKNLWTNGLRPGARMVRVGRA